MRTYKVERNIPIPPLHIQPKGLSGLFRTMRRGDSVRMPKKKAGNAIEAAHRIFGKGKWAMRSNGTHFRLWRTG